MDEIDEALAYYQAIDPMLCSRLTNDIEQALSAIAHMPESWKSIGGGLRQNRLKAFPFLMNYLVRDDKIWIVAFAHTHRKPNYWRDRL
ncbi:MAG: type II toxin-antitoxin system RelE/ParE family toxin [Brachymonas sp.]|nr:type II toxin-antitoxin system RelE/ParE family toxin [Brachymonas sp.]